MNRSGRCPSAWISALTFVVALIWLGEALAQEVHVTDAYGRQIVLSAPAKRIVVPSFPAFGFVVAVAGGPDRIVGMSPTVMTRLNSGIMGQIFPVIRTISTNVILPGAALSAAPNIEAVAALHPDIVVQGGAVASSYQPLLNAGLPVALYASGTEASSQQLIEMIAYLVGMPERGKVLNAWRSGLYSKIQTIGKAVPERDRLRILSITRLDGHKIEAHGRTSNTHEAIELIGAVDVAAHSPSVFGPVNIEDIVGQDPDLIIISDLSTSVASVINHPLLSTTKAVRAKRVYKSPWGGSAWSAWSPEAPFFWMWLAELAYPKTYDLDLRAEMMTWYAFMYGGHELTSGQIDQILFVPENRGSAGYAGFIAN